MLAVGHAAGSFELAAVVADCVEGLGLQAAQLGEPLGAAQAEPLGADGLDLGVVGPEFVDDAFGGLVFGELAVDLAHQCLVALDPVGDRHDRLVRNRRAAQACG